MRVVFLAPILAAALVLCPTNTFAGQSPRASDSDELKQEPKQTRKLLETALRLEKQGLTASAIAAYGELIKQAPGHPGALRHRAQLLMQSGQVEAASHDVSAILLAHPEDAAAWSTYGDCLRLLLRDKDAAAAYSKAIEHGLNSASVNRKRGDALAAAGSDDAALESYSAAVKLRLDDPESYVSRGTLLMKMRRHRDAVDDFTRALDFNPGYADAFFNRGRAWGELSQFEKAANDLTAFLRLKPGDAAALAYRGAAFDTLGRIDEALADYAAALKAEPANSRVLMARAELYTRLNRHSDALADHDRAIVLEPLNAYFYMSRGATQLALGNTAKAVADQSRAVELAPANALMWYSRANTYWTLGERDKALSDAIEALHRNASFEVAKKLIDEIQATPVPRPPRVKLASVLSGAEPENKPAPTATPRRPASGTAKTPDVTLFQTPNPDRAPQAVRVPPAPHASVAVMRQAATAPRVPPAQTESARPLPKANVSEQAPATSKQLYRDGRALLQQNDFVASTAKFTQAVALDPQDPLIWNALGYSQLRQQHYKQAVEAFDKAISLNPRYQNAFANRSAAKRALGDGSGAAHDRAQAKQLAERR